MYCKEHVLIMRSFESTIMLRNFQKYTSNGIIHSRMSVSVMDV